MFGLVVEGVASVFSLPGAGFGHKVAPRRPSVAADTAAYHGVVSCHAPLPQESRSPSSSTAPASMPRRPGEARYRVVATDSVSGGRIFVKCRTEERPGARPASSKAPSPSPPPSATPMMLVRARWSGSPPATSKTICRACRCVSGRNRPTCCYCCYSPGSAPESSPLNPRRLRCGDRRRPHRQPPFPDMVWTGSALWITLIWADRLLRRGRSTESRPIPEM